MRTRAHHVALATITLFLVGLSGCLDDFGTEEAPTWKTGYAFAYEGSADLRIDAVATENGEVLDELHEQENQRFAYFLEVLDDDYDAAGEPVYLSGLAVPGLSEAFAQAGVDLPGVLPVGIRHRDLGTLYPEVSVAQACSNNDCDPDLEFTFRPAGDSPTHIAFPLEKGDSWVWENQDDGHLRVVVRSEAEGAETITTELGTFEAIRIAVTLRIHGVDDAIAEVRQEITAEGGEVHALEYSVGGSATMWYSPAHGTVAKAKSAFEERGHIKVSFRGDTFEETFHARVESQESLVGARLIPGPERSQANIKQVFLGGETLIDPTGETTPLGGSYKIELGGDKQQVNAADADEVSFQVTVTPDLPTGDQVLYDIRGPDGNVVASGEGLSFRHTFDDPGVHVIQVWGVDGDGKAQATDAMVVVADYRVTVPAFCMPVGTSLAAPLGCDPVPVPVRNGIRSLDITFTTASVPVLEQLVLEDAHGNRVSAPSSLHLEDFSAFEVDGSDWTVSWEPLVHAAEEGEFEIHLAHGARTGGQAGGAASYLPAGAALAYMDGGSVMQNVNWHDWLHAGADGLPGQIVDLQA